jgi:hypothetical protein
MVPRPDELPTGVQAPEHAEAGTERTTGGTWVKGASTAQRKGGRALKNRTALSHTRGLSNLLALPAFAPYLSQAKAFAKQHVGTLARAVGGGECDAGAASVVTTAALQLAASRYLFDQAAETGDPDLFLKAAKLGDQSRANLLSARELVALGAGDNKGKHYAAAHEAARQAFTRKPNDGT